MHAADGWTVAGLKLQSIHGGKLAHVVACVRVSGSSVTTFAIVTNLYLVSCSLLLRAKEGSKHQHCTPGRMAVCRATKSGWADRGAWGPAQAEQSWREGTRAVPQPVAYRGSVMHASCWRGRLPLCECQ
jgi:hypothetical protein